MGKVLVLGGAGYVGSSVCARLVDLGHRVVVVDQFSTGFRELNLGHSLIECAMGDTQTLTGALLNEIKSHGAFDCAMHFAARCVVSESVEKPELYHENNVLQGLSLLKTLESVGLKRIVFSSSCAIFGAPTSATLAEDAPVQPLHPYGQNKADFEAALRKASQERGFQAIALRYFNAAGTESKLRVGELHEPETHLIPRILESARDGQPVELFGDDYPTPDGTCIRDYIHVEDLADAHIRAMELLVRGDGQPTFLAFNVGSGRGYSVKEVIATTEKVLAKKIIVQTKPRRPADPPRLVADLTRSTRELGFSPKLGLEQMISSAWAWMQSRQRAVFLDRDGTLNEDPGYLRDPDQLRLLPRTGEALRILKDLGFRLIVVSNQSGVGRGLIPLENLPKIHDRLQELLKPHGVRIDHFEFCIHHPDAQCACRKPKPELLVAAAKKLSINLKDSWMVGDKASDIGAGISARSKGSVLVRTGDGARSEKEISALLSNGSARAFDSLFEFAQWLKRERS